MKKWFRFFTLSFFSDRVSKEGAKRGYTNVFLGLLLSFALLWAGYVGTDMLPFAAHYDNSPDFSSSLHSLLANPDITSRISIEITDGRLAAKSYGGDYSEALLVNTLENERDRQLYSVNSYHLILDTRSARALAEVEAYCVSNDSKEMVISYEDYLTLSEVARLNFDFKLRYTGEELVLTDETCEAYRLYLVGSGEENKSAADQLYADLGEGRITKDEYNSKIYKLYFTNYYPDITEYESSSEVPLLRNYYYHRYLKEGITNYLFIFDDYMAGSFKTAGGVDISFYGFYSDLENGTLISEGADEDEAAAAADRFVKDAYSAMVPLTLYAHGMNIFSLIPFIALMPMVVSLLAYSLLKLRGVDSVSTLGGAFKIVGSYLWFSALVAALLSLVCAFFLSPTVISILPLLLFFITLAVRSVIFAVNEAKAYINQSKKQETVQTEA